MPASAVLLLGAVCSSRLVRIAHDADQHVVCSLRSIRRLRDSVYGREHLALVGPDAGSAVLPVLLPFNDGDDLVRTLLREESPAPSFMPDFGRSAQLASRRPMLQQVIDLRQQAGCEAAPMRLADVAKLPGITAFDAIHEFLVRSGLVLRVAVLGRQARSRNAVRASALGMLTPAAPAAARLQSDASISAQLLCVDAAGNPLSVAVEPSDALALAELGRVAGCELHVQRELFAEVAVSAEAALPASEALLVHEQAAASTDGANAGASSRDDAAGPGNDGASPACGRRGWVRAEGGGVRRRS